MIESDESASTEPLRGLGGRECGDPASTEVGARRNAASNRAVGSNRREDLGADGVGVSAADRLNQSDGAHDHAGRFVLEDAERRELWVLGCGPADLAVHLDLTGVVESGLVSEPRLGQASGIVDA